MVVVLWLLLLLLLIVRFFVVLFLLFLLFGLIFVFLIVKLILIACIYWGKEGVVMVVIGSRRGFTDSSDDCPWGFGVGSVKRPGRQNTT